MNRQGPLLFEAPLAHGITCDSNLYSNRGYYGNPTGEWEQAPECLVGMPVYRETVDKFPIHQYSISSLPTDEQKKIQRIAQLVVNSFKPGCAPVLRIRLEGHADRDTARGPAFEQKISDDRARAMQKALAEAIDTLGRKSGPAPLSSRITWEVRGVGARNLQNKIQRALNRRVVIELVLDTTPKSCAIGTIKIWLNAFIPRDMPGLTAVVPGRSPHAGKTMLHGPSTWINDCFLTDQRDFSASLSPSVTSRMHSEIEIDLTAPSVIRQMHHCDETVEVDCEDGDEECRHRADTSRMRFSKFRCNPCGPAGMVIKVDLVGAANNACFRGSPDIDYNGTITIMVPPTRNAAQVSFAGMIDQFPAFEMYASADGGLPLPLFQLRPLPGKSPGNLFRDANRPVTGSVTLSCPRVAHASSKGNSRSRVASTSHGIPVRSKA